MKGEKAFQFFAVLLCICMSTSAFASQGYLQKISAFYDQYGNKGSMDEFCKIKVAAYNSTTSGFNNWKYRDGSWEWNPSYNSYAVRCEISSPNRIMGLNIFMYCNEGGKVNKELMGCYELRKDKPPSDCDTDNTSGGYSVCADVPKPECPEGQVKEGEQCIDECEFAEKNGTPLPEGCPQCPDEPPKSIYGKVQGAVACNNGYSKICTYVDTPYYFGGSYWSQTAKGIATKCIEAHEREHKNDSTLACSKSGWLGFFDEEAQHKGEFAAYKKEEACLQEAKEECGLNPICHLEVWGQIVNSENAKEYYK